MRLTAALRATAAQLPISKWTSPVLKAATSIVTNPSGRKWHKIDIPESIPEGQRKRFKNEARMVAGGQMIPKGIDPEVGDLARDASPIGSHIYFYIHFLSNRVIYSLYRNLYNTKAMKQMTFMGKKTVPSALRKDMWSPFLTVSFTNPETGKKAFQHLRELRKLHETQWDLELFKKPKKERSKILQDQKANSIADLAAICKRDLKVGEKARVRWMNIYDAEYAAEWPEAVVHDVENQTTRYTARKMGKFEPELETGATTATSEPVALPEPVKT